MSIVSSEDGDIFLVCREIMSPWKNIQYVMVIGLLIISVGIIGQLPAFCADRPLQMVSMLPESSPQGMWMKLVYTEAFRRLGLEMSYLHYPAKRATFMTDSGKVDGDLFRAYRYGESQSNLIRVEEPVYTTTVAAFATDPTLQLDGWESLKGTTYRVEFRLGVKLSEDALPQVVREEHLSGIAQWEQGLKKLASGRTDIYIDVEDVVLKALQTESFHDMNIQKVGVMEVAPVHAYLYKTHEELAASLTTVLKQMKEEGLIERYYQQAVK